MAGYGACWADALCPCRDDIVLAELFEPAQQCGWVKDRYGLSWQVIPKAFLDMMTSNNTAGVERAFGAMMNMKKLDMAALQRAFDGK